MEIYISLKYPAFEFNYKIVRNDRKNYKSNDRVKKT